MELIMQAQTVKKEFEQALSKYLLKSRWFRTKSKKIASANILNDQSVEVEGMNCWLSRVEVVFGDATREYYFLPLAFIDDGKLASDYLVKSPVSVVFSSKEYPAVVDALYLPAFRTYLLELLLKNKRAANFQFRSGSAVQNLERYDSKLLRADQTNTSIIYADEWFLKIYRKLEDGINPELEIVQFFSERTDFKNAPQYGGSILYEHPDTSLSIVGLMQNKIPNRGEAWTAMLEILDRYYAEILQASINIPTDTKSVSSWDDLPTTAKSFISQSSYQRVALLGQRTAEMHIALASDNNSQAFAPKDLTLENQITLMQDIRELTVSKFALLEEKLGNFSPEIAAEAELLLSKKTKLLKQLERLERHSIRATKIRVHGDYHLGQVLYDESDFYIIDFEGEPLRTLEERRTKVSPFKDVAGMIRSFHYAAYGELYLHPEKYAHQDMNKLEAWAAYWYEVMQACFLDSYLRTCGTHDFIPQAMAERELLLEAYLLEKSVYEIAYELNARPDWLRIPLRGVLQVVGD